MTKEEVASIVLYCRENNVSFKYRLEELNIKPWKFYDAKCRFSKDGNNELIALDGGSAFVQCPDFTSRNTCSGSRQKSSSGDVSIEMQTSDGVIMRIHGNLDESRLRSIISSAVHHV